MRLLSLLLALSMCCANAQKLELGVNGYGGSSGFHGNGTFLTSAIYDYTDQFQNTPQLLLSNRMVKKGEFSYAVEFQLQYVTSRKHLIGAGLSYERLTSKIDIDSLVRYDRAVIHRYLATGKTTLVNSFITLNPFVGHRFSAGQFAFDVLGGVDLAFCLRSHEAGRGIALNHEDTISYERNTTHPSVDLRPRIQIAARYKKFSLLFAYSSGLSNFLWPSPRAYARFLRMGIGYRFK